MPTGILLWKWDSRSGAEILGQWPKEVEVGTKTLMQLYSTHLYSAKADVISMYVGSLNLVSMWTGSIQNYFLTLLLKQDEDPDNFTEIISDSMYYLVPFIDQDTYSPILPTIFQRFEEYPSANFEQRRAILYSNDLNRTIIRALQEEGIYFKDELKIWLEESLKTTVFNYDIAIERLSHNNFIKVATVKGVEGTYLFLINDFVMLRAPPLDLAQKQHGQNDPTLYDQIILKIREYFKYYRTSERDNLQILNLISQSNYYKIIDFLRKTHANESTLRKLTIHGVQDIFNLINNLKNLDIVDTVKHRNGDLIYFLKSDIVLDQSRPDFMMRRIYNMRQEGKKNPVLLRNYINILKESFYEDRIKEKLSKRAAFVKKEDVFAA
jgi:hypothetical protein